MCLCSVCIPHYHNHWQIRSHAITSNKDSMIIIHWNTTCFDCKSNWFPRTGQLTENCNNNKHKNHTICENNVKYFLLWWSSSSYGSDAYLDNVSEVMDLSKPWIIVDDVTQTLFQCCHQFIQCCTTDNTKQIIREFAANQCSVSLFLRPSNRKSVRGSMCIVLYWLS